MGARVHVRSVTLKDSVTYYMLHHPERSARAITNDDLYGAFPDAKKGRLRSIKSDVLKALDSPNPPKSSHISSPLSHTVPPTRDDPPAPPPVAGGEQLDPKAIMIQLAREGNFNAAKFLIDNPGMFGHANVAITSMPYVNPFPRHNLLATTHKQKDLYLAAVYHSVTVIGVRGTAKTVTLEDAAKTKCIMHQNPHDPLHIAVFSGKQDTAKKRVGQISRLLKLAGMPDSYYLKDSEVEFELQNGNKVKAYALTVADIHSERANVIWLDEAQFIPRDMFDALIPLFSGKKDIQLWISGNALESDSSAFETIATDPDDEFHKAMADFLQMTTIWLDESDIYWTEEKDKQIVRTLLSKLGSENAVAKEMTNEFVRKEGTYYSHADIKQAYLPCELPKQEQLDKIGCGIDWGDTHDTCFRVMGFLNGEAYEYYWKYLTHPTNTELILEFQKIRREFPGVKFVWETSAMGSFARNEMRRTYKEFTYINSNFSNHKDAYIDNLYIWLADQDIHLRDPKLRRQLERYCGDKVDDDGHDALVHVLFKIVPPRTAMKITMTAVMKESDTSYDDDYE